MIRLIHKKDLELISHLPSEVKAETSKILTILDDDYGIERDYKKSLGGYLIVVQNAADLIKLTDDGIDLRIAIPEYADKIKCENGVEYTSLLFLLSSDYSISLIIPSQLIPPRLLEWVVN